MGIARHYFRADCKMFPSFLSLLCFFHFFLNNDDLVYLFSKLRDVSY